MYNTDFVIAYAYICAYNSCHIQPLSLSYSPSSFTIPKLYELTETGKSRLGRDIQGVIGFTSVLVAYKARSNMILYMMQ